MRKIASIGENERKQSMIKWTVAIIILGILILSTVGFSFTGFNRQNQDNEATTTNEGGVEFTPAGEFWTAVFQGKTFIFSYLPSQIQSIEGIEATAPIFSSYTGGILYIYSENQGAEEELLRNMQGTVQRVQRACHESIKDCASDENLPLKTCQDNFVIIKSGEANSIKRDGNCVFISGADDELVKIVDVFFYKSLGISP